MRQAERTLPKVVVVHKGETVDIHHPEPQREKVPAYGMLFRERLTKHTKNKKLGLELRILAAFLSRQHGNSELSTDMLALFTGATKQGVIYTLKKLVEFGLVAKVPDCGNRQLYRISPHLYYSGKPQSWATLCREYPVSLPEEAQP